jgi:hypothetical protein
MTGLPILIGTGGLTFELEDGEPVELGVGAGVSSVAAGGGEGGGDEGEGEPEGEGEGEGDEGAPGAPPGAERAGPGAAPGAGAEYTAGGWTTAPGIPGLTPIVGVTEYPPCGPIMAGGQLPATHDIGKSSHVSHCVHPTAPAAQATTTIRRLTRPIPVSFP